jgi:DNA-binding transcriptional MocR family regulator
MLDDSGGRIAHELREWIATAPPGAQLPSTRALAARHQAGPVTVQKALRTLTAQGLVEARPGVGTFVRAVRAARPADYGWQTAAMSATAAPAAALPTALRTAPNDVIALHAGFPDRELLPERLVRSALARAARTDAALSRPPAAGSPELQAWFAGELGAATPADVAAPTPRDVVVLPGSQSGLSAVFGSLVGRGQPVLMESPTYWGAIQAATRAGVRIVPVPTSAEGPDPDELSRAFAVSGARLFYAQPSYANPTGAQWSSDRARQVLEVVRTHGAFLLEDDWARDFGITTTPSPVAARDDSGHVLYLRSLTKSVSPALRVAGIVARGAARDRLLADRAAESLYVSGLLQAAALDVVTQPAWDRHLRGLRQHLRARRDLLVAALAEHAPQVHLEQVPAGGLHLWARLPDDTDLARVVGGCEAAGVVVAPGTEWFPAEPTAPYLRLSFAGPDPGRFADGARILGEVLARNGC